MKTITLNHITKIEGHAKLEINIDHDSVQKCELSAVEGSRYFEGLVVGRKYNEAHEITSRICGICSCAHVTAAIMAIEDAMEYQPTEQTKHLRELLMLGERIRSHATHLYFLALPDYLGYESALAMAKKYKAELQHALLLMKTGNRIIKHIGGRDLHPVSATVGGWLKLPTTDELRLLAKDLRAAKKDAKKTCDLFFSLTQPAMKTDVEWFSLKNDKNFALLDGKFSSPTSNFNKHEYRTFLTEYHEDRSTSNFVVKKDHRYFVGALARINNNHEFLSKDTKKIIKENKLKLPSYNPYHNNLAQALEIMHCLDHAIQICESITIKSETVEQLNIKAGKGVAAIEVPRGTLWHEYSVDEKGIITNCNIITPTAQNLLNMQEDIRAVIPLLLKRKKTKEGMINDVEKLIRAYDPCFSCSAHFLEVKWT